MDPVMPHAIRSSEVVCNAGRDGLERLPGEFIKNSFLLIGR
jgi:hypothetical protein